MADYTSVILQYNSGAGTDASPVWTGAALSTGGSSGANELRMGLSTGSQTTSTASASWPFMQRPASGTSPVDRLYAFSADTTGLQITTYTGDNTKANVIRVSFDALGNPVSAMQGSFFADTTHTAPSAGTQPPGSHNDAFTNGHSSDTGSASYIKGNAYGSGLTAGGTQETPAAGSVGTAPTATTGSAGSTTTTAGNWLNTAGAWTSLQGFVQYILAGAIVHTAQAFFWYWTFVIFLGANITAGTYNIVMTLQYTYS